MICVCTARYSIAEIMTPPAAPDDGAHERKVETAQSDVPVETFVDYGKQGVNPLALLADLLLPWPE